MAITELRGPIHTGAPGEGNYMHALVELANWDDVDDDSEPTCSARIDDEPDSERLQPRRDAGFCTSCGGDAPATGRGKFDRCLEAGRAAAAERRARAAERSLVKRA